MWAPKLRLFGIQRGRAGRGEGGAEDHGDQPAGANPAAGKLLNLRRWSQKTMILLVMQSLDNSLTTSLKKTRLGRTVLTSAQGHGEPNPTFIRAGYEANKLVAEKIGGVQGGTWNEMLEVPLTAHFLGGCAIGDSASNGVVDAYHRVFGYEGLHIVDGSTVSANLGVNPSLPFIDTRTVTARSRAAAS